MLTEELLTAPAAGPDAGSPLIFAVALSYLAVYAARWVRCRRDPAVRSPSVGRLCSFATGCALLAAALGPPLDEWAERSATAHMTQHIVILDLVPILLFAGLTKAMLRPVTRRLHGIERRMGPVAAPIFAVAAYCGLMFAWHVPALYDLALRNQAVHAIEHLTLMTAGLLYWWHLMAPVRDRSRLTGVGPAVYMASTKVLIGTLGLVLIFSPASLYSYRGGMFGMDRLTDQHVAGLVMATEQTLVMGVAFAVIFLRMLDATERDQARAERFRENPAQTDR